MGGLRLLWHSSAVMSLLLIPAYSGSNIGESPVTPPAPPPAFFGDDDSAYPGVHTTPSPVGRSG